HRGYRIRVATEQHYRATETQDGRTQGSEIRALAVPTGDQHQLAGDVRAQPVDGRQRRADVGRLGVVVVADTFELAYPLATMGQAGEAPQNRKHRLQRQIQRLPKGQRGQGVGLVVGTTDL